jgi:hypothetical protein
MTAAATSCQTFSACAEDVSARLRWREGCGGDSGALSRMGVSDRATRAMRLKVRQSMALVA